MGKSAHTISMMMEPMQEIKRKILSLMRLFQSSIQSCDSNHPYKTNEQIVMKKGRSYKKLRSYKR